MPSCVPLLVYAVPVQVPQLHSSKLRNRVSQLTLLPGGKGLISLSLPLSISLFFFFFFLFITPVEEDIR